MTLALILAMYFGENRRGARTAGDLLLAGMFAAIPFLLIAKQPDLGTAVTLQSLTTTSGADSAASSVRL